MSDNGSSYFEKRCESLAKGIEDIRIQLLYCEKMNNVLTAEKKQWELEKISQQSIIQQTLSNMNMQHNLILEENRMLKEEIKRLKG